MQFLVEAVILSGLGGTIGIVMGLTFAALATQTLDVPLILDPAIILIAVAFSAIVGIVFGYFPARRAAHFDPIDALRHE
jgi:putative ABC transport system permease protein